MAKCPLNGLAVGTDPLVEAVKRLGAHSDVALIRSFFRGWRVVICSFFRGWRVVICSFFRGLRVVIRSFFRSCTLHLGFGCDIIRA